MRYFRGISQITIPAKGRRKSKIAKNLLFASQFQLQNLANTNKLWIDATFKCAPPGFYQVLHILAYDSRTNFVVVVAQALMSAKDEEAYAV